MRLVTTCAHIISTYWYGTVGLSTSNISVVSQAIGPSSSYFRENQKCAPCMLLFNTKTMQCGHLHSSQYSNFTTHKTSWGENYCMKERMRTEGWSQHNRILLHPQEICFSFNHHTVVLFHRHPQGQHRHNKTFRAFSIWINLKKRDFTHFTETGHTRTRLQTGKQTTELTQTLEILLVPCKREFLFPAIA